MTTLEDAHRFWARSPLLRPRIGWFRRYSGPYNTGRRRFVEHVAQCPWCGLEHRRRYYGPAPRTSHANCPRSRFDHRYELRPAAERDAYLIAFYESHK